MPSPATKVSVAGEGVFVQDAHAGGALSADVATPTAGTTLASERGSMSSQLRRSGPPYPGGPR